MCPDAQDQRCEQAQRVRESANRPASHEVENDRQDHDNATGHHAPFHDIATGTRCCRLRRVVGLIVFHVQLQN